MATGKMHDDEVDTDISLVTRLVASQFPHWADLPLSTVESAGTDNAIYRLGEDMAVRLPRIHWATGQADKERKWMPKLAPHLPLAIPVPLARGLPAEGYPWDWSIYQWLDGENLILEQIPDPSQTALDLANFITALQKIDTTDAPLAVDYGLRGESLSTRDDDTREAISALDGMIDTDTVTRIWDSSLHALEWDREPVWFHGDLLPGNLLFTQGRLTAVIDFGGLGVGDPACDLMIAWSLFSGESRDVFRKALQVADATWARGLGHALAQALIFILYYLETNPVGVRNAWHVINEILAED